MVKVGFVSLGCSKNLVDTELMLRRLYDSGFEITPEESEAEIIIVNTCGFIESAKQESIANILDVAELKKWGKCRHIIAAGCLAERYQSEIMDLLPELDAAIGVGSIEDIVDACNAVMRGEKYSSFKDKEKSRLGGERILTTEDYTAYLKIAEGCDNRCTYCAIPLIRGKMRSRPIEDIVKEARELEVLGVKELNLIAQDTSRYGLDLYGRYALCELVREITKNTNIPWIRLLYCYPDKITDELIDELRTNPRLLKYMDIPIQHISDKILLSMNRHGDQHLIKETVKKLRERVPGIVLRTTAMVGFPGETDEDFTRLCEYIKEARFDRFGAFTYSPEEGTESCEFEDQVDEQTKQDRYDVIMQTQLTITEELNEKKIGEIYDCLCEGFDTVGEVYYGRTYADAPDIDGRIYFTSKKKINKGDIIRVKVSEALDYDLVGERID